MSSIPVTVRGAQMLRDELQRLKTKDRYEVIAAIAEARSHGDLSENAEYDAAKERQAFIEGRIAELEGKLLILMEHMLIQMGFILTQWQTVRVTMYMLR